MISVVKIKHDEVAAGGPARLFRSTEPGLADGAQRRDFIWIGDVVDVALWLLDTPDVSGLFNVGTGQARTYLDLANAVCDAAGVPRNIQYIDMPAALARPVSVVHRGHPHPAAQRRLCGPVHAARGRHPAVCAGLSDAGRPLRMIPVLLFPQFDPVIVQIGPFGIRWYALAYIAGLVLGWRLLRRLVQQAPAVATAVQADDFLTWATLGVVLGGRLGYVLFYQPGVYLTHPGMILAVWEGGMSFHGGALGVAVAIVWFCRRNAIPLLGFADRVAVCTPIGLGLGRIANFVNGELWGRPAPDWLPWAMIFPNGGPAPRHPSQLYEALLEGVVLFVVMLALSRHESLRARFGWLTGAFLVGLRHRAHHRRVLPRARRVPGLPDRRRDDGPVAVHSDADRRALAHPAHTLMERLDRFMARANAAYYATHDPFRDFTTSPEISQVFGEILGLWAAVAWEQLGRPDPVLLVEAGPGRGTLMADALRAVRRVAPAFQAALRLHLIETSPRLRAVQAERLPDAVWHDESGYAAGSAAGAAGE